MPLLSPMDKVANVIIAAMRAAQSELPHWLSSLPSAIRRHVFRSSSDRDVTMLRSEQTSGVIASGGTVGPQDVGRGAGAHLRLCKGGSRS